MECRIENVKVSKRLIDSFEAAKLIKNGMTVAMGGYTSSGYPKVIASELVKRKEAGEELSINLITGANVGPLDDIFANADMLSRRIPMCGSKSLASKINEGKVHYVEQAMNRMPRLLKYGAFGDIDVAVVEALGITNDGFIIPTSSIGMVPNLLATAKEIIVEINIAQPEEMKVLHDVFPIDICRRHQPIPLTYVNQRIGEPFIRLNPDKIKHVVASNILDKTTSKADPTSTTHRMVDNLLNFLEMEMNKNFQGKLPPLQTGFGNLATNIVRGFNRSNFKDIQFFGGILGEANIELMLSGKVEAASTGSIEMTDAVLKVLQKNIELIKEIVVIRNGDVTNNAEVIQRLGVIALISGIEVDIYGNVNLSHISGSKVVNGIGGGANFAQNAALSIVILPSTSRGGKISNIVPMVFHTDICEHDIDILITENGIADYRGKDDIERARLTINNCVDIRYRSQMSEYLDRAIETSGGHHPQSPIDAFDWYTRLEEEGTMLRDRE